QQRGGDAAPGAIATPTVEAGIATTVVARWAASLATVFPRGEQSSDAIPLRVGQFVAAHGWPASPGTERSLTSALSLLPICIIGSGAIYKQALAAPSSVSRRCCQVSASPHGAQRRLPAWRVGLLA